MNTWQVIAIGITSLVGSLLVIFTRKWHGKWTGDFEDSGVQKHHRGSPPRIGIVPLLLAVGVGLYFLSTSRLAQAGMAANTLGLLVLTSLPVVLLGLADDVTKKITPRVRMLGAAIAGALVIALLDSRLVRVDVFFFDDLIGFASMSILLTLLMVCGFTNAMNIVDGLNGLAGGLAVLMLAATGVIASRFGDQMIVEMCMVLGIAIVGFLFVNFPRGHLFLGDGGAYLIGFLLVQIWILLVNRNPSITPWCVAAMAFLPTMETIFSIYRRRLRRARRGKAMSPDRLHLHSLVYRRRAALIFSESWAERWVANAAASLAMVCFGAVPIALALVAPTSLIWNVTVVCVASLSYLAWFSRLVHFRGRLRGAPTEQPDVIQAG